MTTHAQIPVDKLHGVTPSMFDIPPGRVPTYLPCQIDHRMRVVTVTLKAGNGYTHHLRTDIEDLPFLKRCWPFEVSTTDRNHPKNKGATKYRKVMKQVARGRWVPLHTLWLMYKHDLRSRWDFDRMSKCRNHDWLDWTNSNVYLPDTNRASEAKRALWMDDHMPAMQDGGREIVQARQYGEQDNPFPEGVSGFGAEAVAWMFKDAAKMHAHSTTRIGNVDKIGEVEGVASKPRPKTHAPAGAGYRP